MAYSLYVKTDSGYTPLSIESSSGTSTSGDYLPLSGGTMTGAILGTNTSQGRTTTNKLKVADFYPSLRHETVYSDASTSTTLLMLCDKYIWLQADTTKNAYNGLRIHPGYMRFYGNTSGAQQSNYVFFGKIGSFTIDLSTAEEDLLITDNWTQTITFTSAEQDSNYYILLTNSNSQVIDNYWITDKTTTGFTVSLTVSVYLEETIEEQKITYILLRTTEG